MDGDTRDKTKTKTPDYCHEQGIAMILFRLHIMNGRLMLSLLNKIEEDRSDREEKTTEIKK